MPETCPLAHFVGLGITTSQLTFVQHHAWPILLGMAQALPLLMQCLHPCLVCPLEGGGRYLLVCRCTPGLNLNQAIVQQDCPDLLLFFCSFCKPYRTRAISNRGGCERYSLLSWENMTHRSLPSLHHGMLVASALFRKAFGTFVTLSQNICAFSHGSVCAHFCRRGHGVPQPCAVRVFFLCFLLQPVINSAFMAANLPTSVVCLFVLFGLCETTSHWFSQVVCCEKYGIKPPA